MSEIERQRIEEEVTGDLLPDEERPGSDMGHGYDETAHADRDRDEDEAEASGPRVQDAFRSGS